MARRIRLHLVFEAEAARIVTITTALLLWERSTDAPMFKNYLFNILLLCPLPRVASSCIQVL